MRKHGARGGEARGAREGVGDQPRLKIAAAPMPPPMHIETTP
jgi:hypothetical protein